MEQFFKSIIDMDTSAVVICNTEHEIIYMNPAAAERYSKRGGYSLVGSSILDCHNEESVKNIMRITGWFMKSPDNNRVFMYHNDKENKDGYMIALRNEKGELIGYYEKHEYRDPDTGKFYDID